MVPAVAVLKWLRGWGPVEDYKYAAARARGWAYEDITDAMVPRWRVWANRFCSDIPCSIYLGLVVWAMPAPTPAFVSLVQPFEVRGWMLGFAVGILFLTSEWLYAKRRVFGVYRGDKGAFVYGTLAGLAYVPMLLPVAVMSVWLPLVFLLPLLYGASYWLMRFLPDPNLRGETVGRGVYGVMLGVAMALAMGAC